MHQPLEIDEYEDFLIRQRMEEAEEEQAWMQFCIDAGERAWPSRSNKRTNENKGNAMLMAEMYPSKYVRAADLKQPLQAVIAGVTMEEINGDRKPVVAFVGVQQSLVLNKTNGRMMAGLYGPDSNGWIGKPVELFVDQVYFKGEKMDSVRVRAPLAGQDGEKIPF